MKTSGYEEALIELAKQKEDVVVLSADTAEKTNIKKSLISASSTLSISRLIAASSN